jgi:hypothetical protein
MINDETQSIPNMDWDSFSKPGTPREGEFKPEITTAVTPEAVIIIRPDLSKEAGRLQQFEANSIVGSVPIGETNFLIKDQQGIKPYHCRIEVSFVASNPDHPIISLRSLEGSVSIKRGSYSFTLPPHVGGSDEGAAVQIAETDILTLGPIFKCRVSMTFDNTRAESKQSRWQLVVTPLQ